MHPFTLKLLLSIVLVSINAVFAQTHQVTGSVHISGAGSGDAVFISAQPVNGGRARHVVVENGQYTLLLPQGTYDVKAAPEIPYFSGVEGETPPQRVIVNADVKGVDFELATVSISGYVRRDCGVAKSNPDDAIEVSLVPTGRPSFDYLTQPIQTDPDGRFEFVFVTGGAIDLKLQARSAEHEGEVNLGSVPPDPSEQFICLTPPPCQRGYGRMIVGFEGKVDRALFEHYGGEVWEPTTAQLEKYGLLVGNIYTDTCEPSGILLDPQVSFVVPDLQMKSADDVLVPVQSAEAKRDERDWAIKKIGADQVWRRMGGGKGRNIRVCVVDGGVDRTHPAIRGRVPAGKSFLAPPHEDPFIDATNHGTAIAGIIASGDEQVGVAPEALIISVKVHTDTSKHASDLLAGVDWASDPSEGNCSVINVSLAVAAHFLRVELTAALRIRINEVMTKVARHALLVAAAGNRNSGAPYFPAAPIPRGPADVAKRISVGGVDANDKRWVESPAYGSNYGWRTLRGGESDFWVTLAAPAVNVPSIKAGGGYDVYTGTSVAAPLVAGVAALVIEKWTRDRREVTPLRLRNHIVDFDNTEPVDQGPPIRDLQPFGGRRVNAVKAVFNAPEE